LPKKKGKNIVWRGGGITEKEEVFSRTGGHTRPTIRRKERILRRRERKRKSRSLLEGNHPNSRKKGIPRANNKQRARGRHEGEREGFFFALAKKTKENVMM